MSDDVAILGADAAIVDAATVVTANEICHLASTDAGQITGVVSIRDIVAVALEELAVAEPLLAG